MDRRSWLWRRKSSEKSPSGETESTGSVSSHSERFSDDQALSNHNTQSPEVTSKAARDDELNESLRTLSDKLAKALLDTSAKEDLVKQHAKVAEEAVSGWERAENEVVVLKKQIDALTQRNSILEERAGHLDGALKECVRELRQARKEQEEKIYDAVAKKSREWEAKKAELENQVVELHTQLQNARADATDAMLADTLSKLEAAEKENSILKLKLLSRTEELELRTRERDLSTHAAETASKQHLDSIKKVAKLEAECRRLKAVARRATLADDHHSVSASSVYAESFRDGQSDSGLESINSEQQCHPDPSASALVTGQGHYSRHEKTRVNFPSAETDLMDDFLEMERLASLPPETHSRNNHGADVDSGETLLRDELESMINRTNELEENLKKVTAEKASLEIALNECQVQIKISEDQLKETEMDLVELKTQLALVNAAKRDAEKEADCTKLMLENSTKLLDEANVNLMLIQNQLTNTNEEKSIVEVELEDANLKKAEAESRVKAIELELETLHSNICALEKAVEQERSVSRQSVVKCEKLEAEISKLKLDSEVQRSAIIEDFRIDQDKELAVAASKFAECQMTIASLGRQLKSLATLEDFLIDSERTVAVI